MVQNVQGAIGGIVSGSVIAVLYLLILTEVYNWSLETTDPNSQWVPLLDSIALTGGEAIALASGGTLLAVAFLVQLMRSFGGR